MPLSERPVGQFGQYWFCESRVRVLATRSADVQGLEAATGGLNEIVFDLRAEGLAGR